MEEEIAVDMMDISRFDFGYSTELVAFPGFSVLKSFALLFHRRRGVEYSSELFGPCIAGIVDDDREEDILWSRSL